MTDVLCGFEGRLNTLETVEPQHGKDGADGLNGKDGEAGRDGLDGKDGRDGRDGLPGLNGERGLDGKDGADGFGFDDLSVEHDGEGGFTFKFARGERVKSFDFRLPCFVDRGVFKDSTAYRAGHAVTFGGSLWLAQKDAPHGKPGLSTDWRLAVKKGRDA